MYETISRKENYRGRIFTALTDTLRTPEGGVIHRDIIAKHSDAAAILAVKENGNVVFVRQYRHAAGADVLELPAGIVDAGESPLECATRELEEETGLIAGKMEFMLKFYTSVGFSDEVVYVYLASELSLGAQNFDEEERIELEEYPFDTAVEMIFDGLIVDAKTIAAILAHNGRKNAGCPKPHG
jgi:ADP-ribose pyrophosphatase